MKLSDSISYSINYGMIHIDDAVKKIASNPAAVKKALQFTTKICEAVDLYFGSKIHTSEMAHAMKGTIDIIVFYGTYKNLVFWLNQFSKESLDQEALRESIKASLSTSYKNEKDIKVQHQLAETIFKTVMANEMYYSKKEVIDIIKVNLTNSGYTYENAKKIAALITIKQKTRSQLQLMYAACFTITDLASNISNLKKWNVVDLSKFAVSIGIQSRIFVFSVDLSSHVFTGTIASAGLFILLVESYHKAKTHGIDYYSIENKKQKKAAYKKFQVSLLGVFSGTTDLVATTAPMLFTLSPATIVALGVISKGTGLVYFLIR